MSENEDYDDVQLDASAVIAGSGGGGLTAPGLIVQGSSNGSLSGGSSPRERSYDDVRAPLDRDQSSPHGRRKSVQVHLERTAKRGRYVLTADDPEIRRILRHGVEKEAQERGLQKPPRVGFRDLVFTRQFSTFDRQNSLSYDSPFRGWFTLFWLCIALLLVRVAAKNWKIHGSVLGGNEIWNMMFERDVVVLGLTDGVMCLATAFGFLLQHAVVRGHLTWEGPGYIIEHLWQTLYLGAVLYWTMYRDWPWTHTVFIVLHCMVFLMKQHSYSFYNGYLSQVYRPQAVESGEPLDIDQLEAFSSVIRDEIADLSSELRGKSASEKNAYPNNLTLTNFADWTVLPTLVYELEYPRQERINWWYVAEKTAATFGIIWVMIVVSQAYIYPPVAETVRMKEAGMTLQERTREFPWIVSDILFPLLLEQILTWYLIWECILNVLAELTRFADRGFYGDWWNSVSFDQYARDWNRPVHNFLLRHVYHSSISSWHLSKSSATFVTFLLSALVHELVMFCLFKKIRGYLFAMQLMQVPLVSLSRTRLLKGRTILGNVIFWIGLFVGPSFITSLYLIV
ncbi:putative mboat family protein [Neofusicoccum parvum UCRNP2]|uniref:Putative mboat family protein n=1 Tax=Botryosphaeria parva (strain UCR-NP2) TaxID=1287680 RepID=R1GE50_BOTPV|nr:putative mboat family protein [Neofusicoccum parvum UCRNP2]